MIFLECFIYTRHSEEMGKGFIDIAYSRFHVKKLILSKYRNPLL